MHATYFQKKLFFYFQADHNIKLDKSHISSTFYFIFLWDKGQI